MQLKNVIISELIYKKPKILEELHKVLGFINIKLLYLLYMNSLFFILNI
jgi:hypothetical protein